MKGEKIGDYNVWGEIKKQS